MALKAASVVQALVVVAICVNVAALVLLTWLQPRAGLYRHGEHVPAPSGYLANGAFLPTAPAECTLLRLSTGGCPYCRADRPDFEKLAMHAAHCRVIALWPGSSKPDSSAGSQQPLQFVGMPLAHVLNPYIVPQTILLDGRGAIVWYRVGTMDEKSLTPGSTL